MKLLGPVLLICLALAGCGGGDKKDAAPTAAATKAATEAPTEASSSGSGDEAEVTSMFNAYLKSLVDRDWDAACSRLAPETTEKLKSNIKQLGIANVPEECADLMKQLYAQIDKDPNAKKAIDDIANTAKVKTVKVDGEWKLIDVN